MVYVFSFKCSLHPFYTSVVLAKLNLFQSNSYSGKTSSYYFMQSVPITGVSIKWRDKW